MPFYPAFSAVGCQLPIVEPFHWIFAMFIIWGTKVRVRPLGCRADFCRSCLLVSRFKVSSVQHASHIYYIPLGYSEKGRYGECQICGSLRSETTSYLLTESQNHVHQPIDELIDGTNPMLRGQLASIANEIEQSIPVANRPMYLVNQFSAIHEPKFKQTEGQVSGYVGLVLIALCILVGLVFAVAHLYVGIGAAVAALIILFMVRNWIVQRSVAKQLKPRLSSFLQATKISFDQLEQSLSSGKTTGKRLRKHLAHSRYDFMRQGLFDDALAVNQNFLQPLPSQIRG